jgi:hypothetical protein
MIPFFRRTFASLRVWLGLDDPSENRLHPSHGWLLPIPVLAPVPAMANQRQDSRGRSARQL